MSDGDAPFSGFVGDCLNNAFFSFLVSFIGIFHKPHRCLKASDSRSGSLSFALAHLFVLSGRQPGAAVFSSCIHILELASGLYQAKLSVHGAVLVATCSGSVFVPFI